jgi:L-ribulose-5-phosphate 3-epimerase
MTPKLRIAAITDEFTAELPVALDAMQKIGMTGAELRVISGKNIMDLSQDELKAVRDEIGKRGMEVISIASPILKCVLPGAPEVDTRFQQDVFASKHTFDDQPRLADHAFEIAKMMNAKIIRVFSYWRSVEPDKCFDGVVKAVTELAEKAAKEGLVIGLENEHACNVGTAVESARVLNAVNHPNLKLVWDPANAMVGGETPFPGGYKALPSDRIAHVHVKDCHMPQADMGTCGDSCRGLEGPDCSLTGRWVHRMALARNTLGRSRRQQDGGKHHLRVEHAWIGGSLASCPDRTAIKYG